MDYKLWSEKILNFYWLIITLSFVGHCIGLIVTIYYFPEYIWDFVLGTIVLPTSIHLVILLVCEYIIRVKKIYSSHVLIIAGTILALVIVVINPNVPGLQLTLLLPMAIALIYFDKKKLFFSFMVNTIGLTMIYLIFPSIRIAVSEYEYFSYIFGLCAGYVVYVAILQRGNEVLENLKQASEKEKELIVKSTMMEKLSKTDALTGLYNHKMFQEYMDDLVVKSISEKRDLQLAVIDIDNFKKINDDFGHSVGDIVLKKVARTVLNSAQQDDIVARYGGEEFAILFQGKDFDASYRIVEEIRENIASLSHDEIQDRKVTVSIGIENFNHRMTKYEFFNNADALLYDAKRSGKNQVFYNKEAVTSYL
ncbi:GGDEF domain-containing protein [Salipaludibacillus sp. CF4.18]|uniref:GGDEF domain-containing protein n=1 Tax=Salipaludibacillus sp. CF4.18 TaxID=3373081 RepID=UPI003EE81CBF